MIDSSATSGLATVMPSSPKPARATSPGAKKGRGMASVIPIPQSNARIRRRSFCWGVSAPACSVTGTVRAMLE